jgi:hypothetical protein
VIEMGFTGKEATTSLKYALNKNKTNKVFHRRFVDYSFAVRIN